MKAVQNVVTVVLEAQVLNMKKELIDTFITAGIAYYLGGDWQEVFRRTRNKSIGSLHRTCDKWATKMKDKDLKEALDTYFGEYE